MCQNVIPIVNLAQKDILDERLDDQSRRYKKTRECEQ
jgi:hypothetical protein